ncbi:MAG TPA: hypothetical protein VGC72_04955 [Candidatus Elarobacter sp.]
MSGASAARSAPPERSASPASASRDEAWREEVARGLLMLKWSSDGIVAMGPDRFPYIAAFPPRVAATIPGLREFQPRDLAQLALAKHAGIAVYMRAVKDHPLYAFSLGAVTAIATDTWQPRDFKKPVGLEPGDHLLFGTPSQDALPAELRRAIADYMRTNDHVDAPKIALLVIKKASGAYQPPPWIMAANLRRSDFPTESAWDAELERMRWFIPPRYDVVRPPPTDAGFAVWFDIVQPVSP